MSLLRRLRFSLPLLLSLSLLLSPPPTPIVMDPIPNPSTTTTASTVSHDENGVVNDFGLLEEEEFQMQLALAINASDPDVHKDPESAQIDAAKQISLGYEASLSDTQGLVQFQSLRYWNYNVIGYEEKVMDEFYDVYGITSNLTEWEKMSLLVDLQTTHISRNLDCEVIVVNRTWIHS
ncbi:hypothetical protein PIB30_005858 [Stylosanthes scabra]|uniref:EDR1/CTR1/ARMC3-like peptidase-like domain-containing protein n=1 Tax=Stylosanthes scabra TaxID=79078 RepID=A0ABU6Z217_9FABA|nr:hypothetical protein [Stylosanthes scabra]